MRVEHTLLTLPIHRRSFDDYYRDHDRFVEGQKPAVEEQWGSSFDELPPHIRIHWKDRWYWPPWFFNDVVGFLKLGTTEDRGLTGQLFLKRRHFPPTAPERLYRANETTRDREQILHFWILTRHSVAEGDRASYLEAVLALISEAESTLRRYGHGTEGAEIWLPEYDLSCIDFAAADRQMRDRGRPRVAAADEADEGARR